MHTFTLQSGEETLHRGIIIAVAGTPHTGLQVILGQQGLHHRTGILTTAVRVVQQARGRKNEKLKLDAVKLSHHGSANGTTGELLALLDCQRYFVSSNGNIFYHPDREAMARVILHGGKRPTLCFNYRSPLNELWDAPTLKTFHRQVSFLAVVSARAVAPPAAMGASGKGRRSTSDVTRKRP